MIDLPDAGLHGAPLVGRSQEELLSRREPDRDGGKIAVGRGPRYALRSRGILPGTADDYRYRPSSYGPLKK